MNTIATKMLLLGFALLPCACAHYPQQQTYYPDNGAYSGGYTIMHRNDYRERPDHYDNGYRPGRTYFPHHQRHDQSYALPRRGNDYSAHQQQKGGYDHQHSRGNSRQHDDKGGSHHNNADRRNHR